MPIERPKGKDFLDLAQLVEEYQRAYDRLAELGLAAKYRSGAYQTKWQMQIDLSEEGFISYVGKFTYKPDKDFDFKNFTSLRSRYDPGKGLIEHQVRLTLRAVPIWFGLAVQYESNIECLGGEVGQTSKEVREHLENLQGLQVKQKTT